MRPGARSILGSLPAYARASVVAALAIGAAGWLWWAARDEPRAFALRDESPWISAAFDDGQGFVALVRGEVLTLLPGEYRVTLLAADGAASLGRLVVGEQGEIVEADEVVRQALR